MLYDFTLQVSPLSTHPELSNKKRFPYFFRTVPPDTFQASAILELLSQHGWKYVSIVYEDDGYGQQGLRGCVNAVLPLKFGVIT